MQRNATPALACLHVVPSALKIDCKLQGTVDPSHEISLPYDKTKKNRYLL
jgi:hypothetical protein